MKKTYIAPELEVVAIKTAGMLAVSKFTVNSDEVNELTTEEILSPEAYFEF